MREKKTGQHIYGDRCEMKGRPRVPIPESPGLVGIAECYAEIGYEVGDRDGYSRAQAEAAERVERMKGLLRRAANSLGVASMLSRREVRELQTEIDAELEK